jgi:GT2 family glycosyltransferase
VSVLSIDLILLDGGDGELPAWPLGRVWRSRLEPRPLADLIRALRLEDASGFLFWDSSFGAPSPQMARKLAIHPAQVAHAGLLVGMIGLPEALDFVCPTWMLNADADPEIESTSWRITWRACFVRSEVLRHCGGPLDAFESLEGSAVEWGYRMAKSGIVLRHVPWMLPAAARGEASSLPLADEMRFLRLSVSGLWSRYALFRMLLSAFRGPFALLSAWKEAGRQSPKASPRKFVHHEGAEPAPDARVSVLIPTVDRYPYLRTVLAQLQTQTIPPFEIIVVDQTDPSGRDPDAGSIRSVCPVRMLYLDSPGQCRARNAGLSIAQGDYVLFLDDDDEIENDLIERHLRCLAQFEADVSAGVANEAGAGALPDEFSFLRMSDVFPTNNCMIRTSVLERSGLFDLAYDRGARADGDLGMRAHLSGALMILNPGVSVFHHHAPMGGLRAHKARKITYAASRTSLTLRHLPSATEAYLWGRYFSARQVREETWLRALGTLAVRGGPMRKLAKLAVGAICLPHTLRRIGDSLDAARELRKAHPAIPSLAPASSRTSGMPSNS